MRSYFIEEIEPDKLQKLAKQLQDKGYQGPIDDIYWFQLPMQVLTATQQDHFQACGPYIVSLELGQDWLKLELLLRARNTFRCSCVGYADSRQRDYCIQLLEDLLAQHGI
ncbi:MAG: hypothetical protein ACOC43_07260 [Desulfohalobiaceae bacterium]